jgi:spoIIIJ-associated protein
MEENLANCIETEGKTVDEAVANALSRLGVDRKDVEIEVLDEGSRGVFNILGARQARVRVRMKPLPGQMPGRSRKQPERLGQPEQDPAEVVRNLLSAMGFDAPVESRETPDGIDITVGSTGADGLLIGKRGETLESLQHIISKMLNRENEEWTHVALDVGGYRKRRESQLEKLALSMADKAQATGQEQTTEPLKASERRIIHVALKDHPAVKSYAVGEGLIKRVVIGPKEGGRS